MINGIDLRTS